jgi:hypothetical protein
MIAEWCIGFLDEFQKAPERNIEDIYYEKKKAKQIPENMVEEILEDLEDLAQEYEEDYNVEYALKRTTAYFKERHLQLHLEEVRRLQENGEGEAAQALSTSYKGLSFRLADDLDLGRKESLDKVKSAFTKLATPLIEYPGALGEILNDQMVRGGFVAMMASEKRGKTWWLLDMAMRAAFNRNKVAFFQAGDMTEAQQIKRIASYLTKLPTLEKYIGDIYTPEADCIRNQLDICDKEQRRNNFGIFTGGEYDEYDIREKVLKEELIEKWKDWEHDYKPCTNCSEFHAERLGTPWLVPKKIPKVVGADDASKKVEEFFIKKGRYFKISTHPNNTLTVRRIKEILKDWEVKPDGRIGHKEEMFIPSVIIVDYADLMVPEKHKEFRHGQNEIWKDLRALSQELDCLVITATQADAKSYERKLLTMSNYSEDKRKFGHVTAMFGLNQDKHGREKQLGIMRINELVIREGEYHSANTVTVLQNLTTGKPFLDSYI